MKMEEEMFICIFICEDKTFYWGPFNTMLEANRYLKSAKKQSVEYYGKDIATRHIRDLNLPIKDLT